MQVKKETNIIVFSGASSSGKSTTAEEMRKIGYQVRDCEIARECIENKLKILKEENPSDTEEMIFNKLSNFAKTPEFMTLVLEKKLAYEQSLDNNQLVIIDSALVCGMAYPVLFNCQISMLLEQKINERLSNYRYRIVFSFEMLLLVNDGVRFENEEERKNLHEELRKQYQKLGYTYISVPPLPVSERVKFIDEKIKLITSAVEMNGIGTKLFSNCKANSLFPYSEGPNQKLYPSFFAHPKEYYANTPFSKPQL